MKINPLVLTGALCFMTGLLLGRYNTPASQQQISTQQVHSNTSQRAAAQKHKLPESENNPLSDQSGLIVNNESQAYVDELEHKLAQQKQEFQEQMAYYQKQLDSYSQAANISKDGGSEESNSIISKDEISKYLSAPFISVIEESDDKFKTSFKQLNTEKEADNWVYTTEQNISDFIMLHELSDKLANVTVQCNRGICEIKGFENEHSTWRLISMDMEMQPWWNFGNTSSRTSNNEEFGNFFYMLATTAP